MSCKQKSIKKQEVSLKIVICQNEQHPLNSKVIFWQNFQICPTLHLNFETWKNCFKILMISKMYKHRISFGINFVKNSFFLSQTFQLHIQI